MKGRVEMPLEVRDRNTSRTNGSHGARPSTRKETGRADTLTSVVGFDRKCRFSA
jgi:hypothetical protein